MKPIKSALEDDANDDAEIKYLPHESVQCSVY